MIIEMRIQLEMSMFLVLNLPTGAIFVFDIRKKKISINEYS